MDFETIYTLFGLGVFAIITFFVFRSDVTKEVQSKEEKRYQILNEYKSRLSKELAPFNDDNKKRLKRKVELLKEFSDELSLNIFFDAVEIKAIVFDLSQED